MSVEGGDRLQAALERISGRGEGAGVRVGFLEGSTYPDGTSTPMVAAVQNFGAPAAGIPARPFFSSMVADKGPRWPEQLGKVLKAADYDAKLALGRMGEYIAGQLRQSILDTNDPPLAERTIERKGFDKPLIDTSNMINSVDYEVVE